MDTLTKNLSAAHEAYVKASWERSTKKSGAAARNFEQANVALIQAAAAHFYGKAVDQVSAREALDFLKTHPLPWQYALKAVA